MRAVIAALLFVALTSRADEPATFSRVDTFSSVRMTTNDLRSLIEHIESLVKTADQPYLDKLAKDAPPWRTPQRIRETLTLGHASSIKLSGPFDWTRLSGLPDVTYHA